MRDSPVIVTCGLSYTNGPCHLGHLRTYVPADFYVRYLRRSGETVVFICGSDNHGTPIVVSNIYWLHKGKMREIKEVIKQFNKEITLITGNVMKRLGLICKSDAFLNAFYNAQVGTELLTLNMEELMQQTFTESEL